MKIYHLKSFSLYLFTLLFASSLWGQSLRNLSYSQRPGTKLIDIKYDLVLASGSAAKIDFFFSFDNGKTYPIPCVSLSGDVGSYVVAGTNKKVVWNVGRDWDQKYTDQGRIKVRSSIAEKMEAIEFAVASIPFRTSNIEESPSWFIGEFYRDPFGDARINGVPLSPPTKFFADQYEVTNHQWNQVVDWARNKGYDLQSVSFMPGEENLPRINVAIKEVVKWLNARSEMEGKTPVFYVDPIEHGADFNNDGKLSAGPDSLRLNSSEQDVSSPSFDWSIIANIDQSQKQKWIQEGWFDFDTNSNRQWDLGEVFIDRNRDGKFEPQEFYDINGNGRRDMGQTIVCRTGDISAWYQNYVPANANDGYTGWGLMMHVKESANGYRLPHGQPLGWIGWERDSFRFLAMGGRTEQGSYQTWEDWTQPGTMDPITFEWKQPMKTGIRYVEEWPWGAQSPDNIPDISEYAVTPYGANPAPGIQPVGGRKPNGYGLHDMIGNVAELTMDWYIDPYINPDPSMGMMPVSHAVGGSFSKLPVQHDMQHDPFMSQNNNSLSPRSVMSLGQSLPGTGSPEVGFRAIRMEF